eukprot:87067-Rhodomonas_salina.2
MVLPEAGGAVAGGVGGGERVCMGARRGERGKRGEREERERGQGEREGGRREVCAGGCGSGSTE